MKKTTLAALALTLSGAMALPCSEVRAQETSPTATTDVYNFDNVSPVTLMHLFKTALDEGRNYPTEAEFEAAGILPSDIAFIRSHVRKAKILDRSDRLVTKTYETRNLWCNFPMDIGQDGLAGYPDGAFASDVFSMWQYTNLFGSWNHGFFQAPGAWVDAAHKNGTDIMSGIMFFDTTGGRGQGADNWVDIISQKNDDGSFTYVKPIINCLMFFGADGINYNWEDTGFSEDDVIAFHKALYKEAEAQGFDNFHLGLYTSNSTLTANNANALYGNSEGQTADLMLNYAGGDFSYGISASSTAAQNATGSTERLYTGVWIVNMNRRWKALDTDANSHKVGICLWGEHAQSRFMSYNSGADAMETQENYQRLLERGFSGGNRNPASRPAVSNTGNNWEEESGKLPLSTFCGLAEFIPERSAIQGNLPFSTYFNLGNGEIYTYKGKKTHGGWYNMSNQDVVPTYRWLVYNAGTETVSTSIQPEFSHADSYTGGSCLKLAGAATSTGTDIILYKTQLTPSEGSPVVKLAVKNGKTGSNASCLSLIVRKQGTSTWIEVPYGDVSGETWEEKTLDLSGIATGDVIDRIGLRVKGDDADYTLYVGKLEISDSYTATSAGVKDLVAEVKEETKGSMSLKLNWKINGTAQDRAAWDLLYNDEANIDHFEVLYKNGEGGRVSEVGRTSQWATVINDITFSGTDDDPYIGVRSVSKDLKTYSAVEWLHVARADQSTLPNYVPDTYGVSQMDPSCEGADIARAQRYVTDVTTTGADQNLDYHATAPVADGTQYANALDQTLIVKQGQEVELYIKCYDTSSLSNVDGLRYCFAGGWIDLDGNGKFNADNITDNPSHGEQLFFLGKTRAATVEFETKGITHTFTIPSDAAPGPSRLRIVFSDAWFAGMFQPVGLHSKGFTIDFNVQITGTNEARAAESDGRDTGTSDEPDGLSDASGIATVDGPAKAGFTITDGVISFSNADKAWIYSAEGRLVKYVKDGKSSLTHLYPGVYIVKMQSDNVIRSQKVVIR